MIPRVREKPTSDFYRRVVLGEFLPPIPQLKSEVRRAYRGTHFVRAIEPSFCSREETFRLVLWVKLVVGYAREIAADRAQLFGTRVFHTDREELGLTVRDHNDRVPVPHRAALFDLLAKCGYYWHIRVDVVALVFVVSSLYLQHRASNLRASHLFYQPVNLAHCVRMAVKRVCLELLLEVNGWVVLCLTDHPVACSRLSCDKYWL